MRETHRGGKHVALRMLSGVLGMYKPQDFTSFDVIAKLRGIIRIKRLGHTGTLDPMAEGVLPVLVGSAAKACDILPNETKTYRAGFLLGTVTDTQDITGTVLEIHPAHISREQLTAVFPQFQGDILQIPPMFSAVQIDGKRLYELARAGKTIERPARPVTVFSLTLLSYEEATGRGEAEIVCGKGTYVRTLLHDIGQTLGCGCCMTTLIRTAACGLTLDDCHTFDEVRQAMEQDSLASLLTPTETLFADLPALHLNATQTRLYRNGVKLDLQRIEHLTDAVRYRVYAENAQFIGLAQADFSEQVLRVFKNFEG